MNSIVRLKNLKSINSIWIGSIGGTWSSGIPVSMRLLKFFSILIINNWWIIFPSELRAYTEPHSSPDHPHHQHISSSPIQGRCNTNLENNSHHGRKYLIIYTQRHCVDQQKYFPYHLDRCICPDTLNYELKLLCQDNRNVCPRQFQLDITFHYINWFLVMVSFFLKLILSINTK